MASCDEGKNEKKLDFEDTELRLGFPPNGGENSKYGKRGFEDTDLKLNLATKESTTTGLKDSRKDHYAKPPAKTQVVGWPPMASFRKNFMAVQKDSDETNEKGSAFVKVSVDGIPYMRKVDLKMYKTYQDLSDALGKMFGYFTMQGKCEAEGGSMDYVPTYQDKDGDWMLAGDVPWEMFVESCKRLRVMKGTEARGLAMEKGKGRS